MRDKNSILTLTLKAHLIIDTRHVAVPCAVIFFQQYFRDGFAAGDDFAQRVEIAGFIVTTANAPAVPVDSIRAGVGTIDFAAVIAQLPEGIIHVEGGPQLNAALFDADVVDAINLTWSPRLVGSRGPSISAAPHAMQSFSLASLNTEEEFVFARYERTVNA